jgi:hypothetical protein
MPKSIFLAAKHEVSLCNWVQLEVTPKAAAALNSEWQFMFG